MNLNFLKRPSHGSTTCMVMLLCDLLKNYTYSCTYITPINDKKKEEKCMHPFTDNRTKFVYFFTFACIEIEHFADVVFECCCLVCGYTYTNICLKHHNIYDTILYVCCLYYWISKVIEMINENWLFLFCYFESYCFNENE